MPRETFALLSAALFFATMTGATPRVQAQDQPVSANQTLKVEELDQLVAGIALYPDTLLAEVLMASTYPLEVVQANRWLQKNKSLKGDDLKEEVDKKPWEQSIKSLAATPDVLNMMSEKLDWTRKLGDAVLAQQADVMDAIQRLRDKAQAQGKLESNEKQKVSVRQEQGRQIVVVESANPDTIYVPYYDPAVVYGAWPYPAYPPYYYYPPYIGSGVLASGIAFGIGYAVGHWGWHDNYWGGGINWNNNNLIVNHPINNRPGNNWNHVAHHQDIRHNVGEKFGDRTGSITNRNQRLDFRGSGGKQVLKPGSDRRSQIAAHPGSSDRRPAARPSQKPARDHAAGNRSPAKKQVAAHNNRRQANIAHAARNNRVAHYGGSRPNFNRAAHYGGGRNFSGRSFSGGGRSFGGGGRGGGARGGGGGGRRR